MKVPSIHPQKPTQRTVSQFKEMIAAKVAVRCFVDLGRGEHDTVIQQIELYSLKGDTLVISKYGFGSSDLHSFAWQYSDPALGFSWMGNGPKFYRNEGISDVLSTSLARWERTTYRAWAELEDFVGVVRIDSTYRTFPRTTSHFAPLLAYCAGHLTLEQNVLSQKGGPWDAQIFGDAIMSRFFPFYGMLLREQFQEVRGSAA